MGCARIAAVLVCMVGVYIPRAYAWSSVGHQRITEGAVGQLPQPLRAFFHDQLDTIKSEAGTEPPGAHYINIDCYPEFFAGTLPHNLDDLIAIYGASVVDDNGMGPWTATDYLATLETAMAAAHTKSAWSNLLPTAGDLAHYLEDLHNPLHLTTNYNGQDTGNDGIHSRYESQMVSRYLSSLTITRVPANCVYVPSPIDTIFDGIDVHYWFVDDIMSADTAHRGSPPNYNTAYYAGLWADTGSFTHALFQEASEVVASMWYTAWLDAGSPDPHYALALADYAVFKDCMDGPQLTPTPTAPTTVQDCLDACDLDDDGDVDLADFRTFSRIYAGG
jgi:hypothetical protein